MSYGWAKDAEAHARQRAQTGFEAWRPCSDCEGTGTIPVVGESGEVLWQSTCGTCVGTGWTTYLTAGHVVVTDPTDEAHT